MYEFGQGVAQDYVLAHMWFNISAASGKVRGSALRWIIASMMTPAAIEEVQRRARVCMASNYQDCG